MPTDGLSFAVFVRRQVEVLGVLQSGLQLADLRGLLRRNDVDRIEILGDIHSQVGPIFLLELLGHFFGPVAANRGYVRYWPRWCKPRPRNLPMVRALAGDSTITSEVPPEVVVFLAM